MLIIEPTSQFSSSRIFICLSTPVHTPRSDPRSNLRSLAMRLPSSRQGANYVNCSELSPFGEPKKKKRPTCVLPPFKRRIPRDIRRPCFCRGPSVLMLCPRFVSIGCALPRGKRRGVVEARAPCFKPRCPFCGTDLIISLINDLSSRESGCFLHSTRLAQRRAAVVRHCPPSANQGTINSHVPLSQRDSAPQSYILTWSRSDRLGSVRMSQVARARFFANRTASR